MPVELEAHPPERRERPLIVAGGCCSCCCCCSCCVHSLGGMIGGAIASGRVLRRPEAEATDTWAEDEAHAERKAAVSFYWTTFMAVTALSFVGTTLAADLLWGLALVFLGLPLLQMVASVISLAYCVSHRERLGALGAVTWYSFFGGVLIWLLLGALLVPMLGRL